MEEFDRFRLVAASATPTVPSTADAHADLLELRLDGCEHPAGAVDAVTSDLPLIVTNRPSWEGGAYVGDESDRLGILEEAMQHEQVVAVDVELATLETAAGAALAEQAHAVDVWVIASVHDFEATPPRSVCERLLYSATDHGDVGKLAVTAQTPADAARLLSVTAAVAGWGRPVATMAMGAVGAHTRAVAPTYGSVLGYAPADPDAPTAPGQLSLGTLSTLLTHLR
jgi:3-dehydroquinate dehydratase (EC 4.2.1.10)